MYDWINTPYQRGSSNHLIGNLPLKWYFAISQSKYFATIFTMWALGCIQCRPVFLLEFKRVGYSLFVWYISSGLICLLRFLYQCMPLHHHPQFSLIWRPVHTDNNSRSKLRLQILTSENWLEDNSTYGMTAYRNHDLSFQELKTMFPYSTDQGFSQDVRIWGELGVQFIFIPLHNYRPTQKVWISGGPFICSRYTTPAKCSRNMFSVHERSYYEHCEMFSVPIRADSGLRAKPRPLRTLFSVHEHSYLFWMCTKGAICSENMVWPCSSWNCSSGNNSL